MQLWEVLLAAGFGIILWAIGRIDGYASGYYDGVNDALAVADECAPEDINSTEDIDETDVGQ